MIGMQIHGMELLKLQFCNLKNTESQSNQTVRDYCAFASHPSFDKEEPPHQLPRRLPLAPWLTDDVTTETEKEKKFGVQKSA